jgi:cysteine synthase A
MLVVRDAESISAARVLSERLGRSCGGSTGTNLWACARLISEMVAQGESGSVVSILCDQGERYASTYFNDEWVAAKGLDLSCGMQVMRDFFAGRGFGTPEPADRQRV